MSSRNPSYFVGKPIESMQYMLRVLSQGDRRLLPVTPDGIFGQNTMAAVIAFQRAFGLPATGVVNQATWERLAEEYHREAVLQYQAEPLLILLNPRQVIQPGEVNQHVYLIQSVLQALSRTYGGLPQVGFTGIMDAPTVAAVRRFQGLSGLRTTGAVDKQTWQNLARQYTMAAGTGGVRR